MHKFRQLLAVGSGLALSAVVSIAHATEPNAWDPVVTAIEGHQPFLIAVGAAVLGTLFLARVFSWGRKI